MHLRQSLKIYFKPTKINNTEISIWRIAVSTIERIFLFNECNSANNINDDKKTYTMIVAPTKFDALAAFGGSMVVAIIQGELPARCNKKAINVLALNLAYDIRRTKNVNETSAFL